jgi:hypothetical protein
MVFAKLGRIAPRDRGLISCRHCDEAIQLSISLRQSWIASSRSLSSGAHSRDPLAPRSNDLKDLAWLSEN